MKFRWKPVLSLAASALCFSLLNAAAHAGDDFKDFSKAREFTGTITPEVTVDIPYGFNDEYRGIIYYTARSGDIFRGPEFDIKGNILKKGDPIIKMYTDYSNVKLKEKMAKLDQANAALQLAQQEYSRCSKLIKSSNVSLHDYEQAKANYYNKKAGVDAAQAQVILRKEILSLCTYNAQFTGIVNKVYFTNGLTAGGEPNVISISQLVPIAVSVDMDRTLANQITPATHVTVYPMPSVSKEAQGTIHGYSYLSDTGIMFELGNYLVKDEYLENGKALPNVYEIQTVGNMFNIPPEALDINAVKKDAKGHYVWKAVGQKNALPGVSIAPAFQVKKVYISPVNKDFEITPDLLYVVYKPVSELQPNDVIVPEMPYGVNDGDKVHFSSPRFIFMPGDKVRVVIGPNDPEDQN